MTARRKQRPRPRVTFFGLTLKEVMAAFDAGVVAHVKKKPHAKVKS